MKDVNDSARLPEEEKEAAVSEDKERNETELETAEVADGAQNEEEQTAEEPAESEDAQTEQIRMETVDPAFQISKRQGDGSWEPQSVWISCAEASDEEPEEEESQPITENKPVSDRTRRIRQIVAGAVAAVVVLTVGGLSLYTYQYPNIFHGVKLASEFSLSGMTEEQAAQYIESDCGSSILNHDITVTGDGKEFTLHVADVAEQVDGAATAEAAYRIGREGNYFQRVGAVVAALFGQNNIDAVIKTDDKALQKFVKGVHGKVQYDPVQPSFKIDKTNAVMTIDTGKTGLDFNQKTMRRELKEQISGMSFDPYEIETYVLNQQKPNAEKMAKDASCEAENAKVDTETGEILHSVHGVKVTAKAISDAVGDASKQTYTVPVEITKPELTAKQLEKVLFRDVLAQTTTYYSGGYSRTTNVRLTAEACDNTILNPGDEFSYNGIVGERTPERGYQTATIFVDGKSVEDYGGGACQSSSTIYMAVLRADLEVTERRNHQFQITYTPISQDATVAWGSQDFKFVNDTDYPIKIDMSMGDGALTCTIYGTKTDDKTVELSSTSYVSGNYRYATLYKTVTVNGESETHVENESSYRLGEH